VADAQEGGSFSFVSLLSLSLPHVPRFLRCPPVEVDRALDLLDRQLSRRTRSGEERLQDDAYLMCMMEMACLKVRKAGGMAAHGVAVESVTALLEEVKASLAKGKSLMDGPTIPDGADPSVPASYYRANMEYFKLKGPPHLFYENALLYLGNTSLDSLSQEEKLSLAVDVALAALIGEGVYNFGEVNAHPLLQALETTPGSPHGWLAQLLRAFQAGDIDSFNAVVGANKQAFDAAPALAASSALLKEKVTLLAVMELAAKRSDRGAISFEEVAAATRLPQDQVEWVLMRAFSLGLIRGSIDQVDKTVAITFVKPRVLDHQQVVALRDRLVDWRDRTGNVLQFVEDRTREVLKA
jgi:26S proteasome regulatory subunit N9